MNLIPLIDKLSAENNPPREELKLLLGNMTTEEEAYLLPQQERQLRQYMAGMSFSEASLSFPITAGTTADTAAYVHQTRTRNATACQ